MVSSNVNKKETFDKYNVFELNEDYQKELRCVEDSLSKLDSKFKCLYEDKIAGTITEHNFTNMIKEVQKEQEAIIKRKEELLRIKNLSQNDDDILDKYKKQLKDLIDLKNIDRSVIETFVDKILVEQKANSKEKTIRIFYKFSNQEKTTSIKYRK